MAERPDTGGANPPATLFFRNDDAAPPPWAERTGAVPHPRSLLDDEESARAALAAAGAALLDANGSGFVAMARRIHALDPALQVVAVAAPEAVAAARRTLLYAPGLGEVWIASASDVTGALEERAAGVTLQRRRFDRTRARLEEQRLGESPQRTERALVSDAYLAGLLVVLPDAVFSVDAAGRVLSANAAAERHFAAGPPAIIGERLSIVLRLVDRPPDEVELLQRAANEPHLEVEFRDVGGDLCIGELRAAKLRVRDNTDVWAVLLRDVTEQHLATASLHETSTELEAANEELQSTTEELMQRTEEAEIAVDAERSSRRRIEQLQELTEALAATRTMEDVANVAVPKAVASTGARAGVLALRSVSGEEATLIASDGLPAEAVEQYRGFHLDAPLPSAETMRTGVPVFVESREGESGLDARFPGVRTLWKTLDTQALAVVPLVAGGAIVGAMAFNFDTPRRFSSDDRAFYFALGRQCAQAVERARLFAAERDARARADEANQAKSDFLATMSHELRTPLNAIAGYVQLMEMGIHGPVTEAQRGVLARVNAAQGHLLGLINDVLNFAKLESGRVEYEPEVLAVADVFEEVGPLIAPQLAARGVAFQIREPAGGGAPLHVCADRDKLRQILLNLLSNAAKFTPEGGDVTLEAHCDGGDVAISVRDTGRGIPPDRLEAIFEPFVQLRVPYGPSNEGTGLGLAISRDLARGMNGELTATSRVGEGSTFTVRLPAGAEPCEIAPAAG